ncbi:MAG TPA: hypothetical protein PLN06_11115 [Bacteroidales bacterium]|nr:hypothetical protein [Bacteroidales bacterium]HOU97149.1 hypothetical protein [Bacteroidales bacterium]HRC90430.1 hypothetical protein [Bacteroidales bacterium]
MRNLFFIFLISASLISVSCQKDEEYSAGELIAKELQSVIKENKIERVMNFELDQSWANTWIIGDYGKNYEFQGQFIFIEGESYNLNNLIKYQIAEKSSDNGYVKFLLLTFY